jgi:hypothetical protein
MHIVHSMPTTLKSYGMIILFAALLISCKNGPDDFVAVIVPRKTTSMICGGGKGKIFFSRGNPLKKKITILNSGKETIMIVPADVILRIEKAGVVLRAIDDYKGYVAMRFKEAKRECASSNHSYYCADAIETFFRPFLEAKPFQFGIILPGQEKSGYIAFNLPDPFNRTAEAQQLADSLKSMMSLLDGQIEVNASALSKNRKFVFPVNVTTYSDAQQNPLLIMRYF